MVYLPPPSRLLLHGNVCLWNFWTHDECSFQSKVTVVITAVNSVWYQFQRDDRGVDVTAETVGCSEDGNALHSLLYLCFSAQRKEYIQTVPHGAEAAQSRTVCFGCTLPLWVFICICWSLSSSPLHHAISPPSLDYGFLSCWLWTTFKCTFPIIWRKWASSQHC